MTTPERPALDPDVSEKPRPPAESTRVALLGAMFLMATSAVGPGFITQTTDFTMRLGAAFAFAIVAAILAGDADTAAETMAAHVRASATLLHGFLD